jgi:hypothetical protein
MSNPLEPKLIIFPAPKPASGCYLSQIYSAKMRRALTASEGNFLSNSESTAFISLSEAPFLSKGELSRLAFMSRANSS